MHSLKPCLEKYWDARVRVTLSLQANHCLLLLQSLTQHLLATAEEVRTGLTACESQGLPRSNGINVQWATGRCQYGRTGSRIIAPRPWAGLSYHTAEVYNSRDARIFAGPHLPFYVSSCTQSQMWNELPKAELLGKTDCVCMFDLCPSQCSKVQLLSMRLICAARYCYVAHYAHVLICYI